MLCVCVCVCVCVSFSGGEGRNGNWSERYSVAPTGLQTGEVLTGLCILSPGQKVNVPCRLLNSSHNPQPQGEALLGSDTHNIHRGRERSWVYFLLGSLTLIPNSNLKFSSFPLLLHTSASLCMFAASHHLT